MRFNLQRPCSECPFRSDVPTHDGWLGEARAKELARDIGIDGKTSACHKTLTRRIANRSHCAGAIILQERTGGSGQMLQIAERFGLYDPDRMDMDAPVVKSWQAFIRLHTRKSKAEATP